MARQRQAFPIDGRRFPDPTLAASLFADTRFAWLWLVPRLYLGSVWLGMGWGRPDARSRIDGQGELASVVAVGLTLVAVALILGAFTGAAAFAGGLLCLDDVVFGEGAFTPMEFAMVVGLVLAWKCAGWIGFDRWLLPLVGMPWQGSRLISHLPWKFRRDQESSCDH